MANNSWQKNWPNVRSPGVSKFVRWITISPYEDDGQRFAGVGGLYVIYLLGQVVYVGQTDNLKRRLRDHGFLAPLMLCNDFFRTFSPALKIGVKLRIENDRDKRLADEKALIRKLRPKANGGGRLHHAIEDRVLEVIGTNVGFQL